MAGWPPSSATSTRSLHGRLVNNVTFASTWDTTWSGTNWVIVCVDDRTDRQRRIDKEAKRSRIELENRYSHREFVAGHLTEQIRSGPTEEQRRAAEARARSPPLPSDEGERGMAIDSATAEALREMCGLLKQKQLTDGTRQRAIAITKLEEAEMWLERSDEIHGAHNVADSTPSPE